MQVVRSVAPWALEAGLLRLGEAAAMEDEAQYCTVVAECCQHWGGWTMQQCAIGWVMLLMRHAVWEAQVENRC